MLLVDAGTRRETSCHPLRICAVFMVRFLSFALVLGATAAWAAGPRWITGPPYFNGPGGVPVVWYTNRPLYFTDPGNLSASVSHSAADAMVAAAAGIWNVPTAAITIAQGRTPFSRIHTSIAIVFTPPP